MSKKRVYSYKLTKHKGISKHKVTGHYQARKRINGVEKKKSFKNIRDAIQWLRTFNGITSVDKNNRTKSECSTLAHVWGRYQDLHLFSIQPQSQEKTRLQYRQLQSIEHLRMNEITSTLLTEWLKERVEYFRSQQDIGIGRGVQARYSMSNELKVLRQIFNWYLDEDEFQIESQGLRCPVKQKIFEKGIIKEKLPQSKKIPPKDVIKFFEHLAPFYRDIAIIQYYSACRIGEILGLQHECIDLEAKNIEIKYSAIHDNGKVFSRLGPTKTRSIKNVHITDTLEKCLKRQIANKHPSSQFVFHNNGKPMNYGTVLQRYNRALKKAGLRYSGTHILRHGFATFVREIGGGIDAAMSITGHKDPRVASDYAELNKDLRIETSEKADSFIKSMMKKSKIGHLQVVN